MYVAKAIAIDLNRPRKNIIHLMQNDSFTRWVELTLLCDGIPYNPVSDLSALGIVSGSDSDIIKTVKYIKANGVSGEYEKIPEGGTTNAVALMDGETNVYIVRLDEHATDVPGFAEIFVTFYVEDIDGNMHTLHSFPITLDVNKTTSDTTNPDQPYFDVFLRKSAQAAKTSGMTQAVGVDDNGKLWTAPGSGGGGSDPLIIEITGSGGTYSSDTYHADIQAAVSDGQIVLADTPDGVGYYYAADASGSLFYVLCRIGDAMSSAEYHVTSNAVAREVFTIDNESKLAVLYGSAMSLGASQKLQARSNIDAAEAATVVTSSDSTATITPTANHQYVFSNPILSLEISSSFAATGDWSVEFDGPTNVAPSVTLPSALKTIPESPSFAANKHYEINCHNGYAIVAEW